MLLTLYVFPAFKRLTSAIAVQFVSAMNGPLKY